LPKHRLDAEDKYAKANLVDVNDQADAPSRKRWR
jgi:hypothetical protein